MSERRSVQCFGGDDLPLTLRPPDEKHVDEGEMDNRWSACFLSQDRLLEIGLQEFSGTMTIAPFDGREIITVITHGSGEIQLDDERLLFEAGDVVVFDAPVPTVTIHSAQGYRGVYMTRFRTIEERLRARPDEDATEASP